MTTAKRPDRHGAVADHEPHVAHVTLELEFPLGLHSDQGGREEAAENAATGFAHSRPDHKRDDRCSDVADVLHPVAVLIHLAVALVLGHPRRSLTLLAILAHFMFVMGDVHKSREGSLKANVEPAVGAHGAESRVFLVVNRLGCRAKPSCTHGRA